MRAVTERSEIREKLIAHRDELAKMGVKSLTIIGPIFRPILTIGLVPQGSASFNRSSDLRDFLETLLDRHVNLITSNSTNQKMTKYRSVQISRNARRRKDIRKGKLSKKKKRKIYSDRIKISELHLDKKGLIEVNLTKKELSKDDHTKPKLEETRSKRMGLPGDESIEPPD